METRMLSRIPKGGVVGSLFAVVSIGASAAVVGGAGHPVVVVAAYYPYAPPAVVARAYYPSSPAVVVATPPPLMVVHPGPIRLFGWNRWHDGNPHAYHEGDPAHGGPPPRGGTAGGAPPH